MPDCPPGILFVLIVSWNGVGFPDFDWWHGGVVGVGASRLLLYSLRCRCFVDIRSIKGMEHFLVLERACVCECVCVNIGGLFCSSNFRVYGFLSILVVFWLYGDDELIIDIGYISYFIYRDRLLCMCVYECR